MENPKEFISLEDLHVLVAHLKINTVFSWNIPTTLY